MLGFGVFGYLLKLYGYQIGPIVLGIILSRLMDGNWRRAIISEQDSIPAFLMGIVTSPLSLAFLLVILFALVSQTPWWKSLRNRGAGRA
jgi:putative tricarboxylic transport membrane protein